MRCAFDFKLFNTDYLFDQIVYNSRAHKKKKVYRDHHLPSALLFLIFVHRTVHKRRLQLKGSKFQQKIWHISTYCHLKLQNWGKEGASKSQKWFANILYRDVARSENLGGRVITWGPKIWGGPGRTARTPALPPRFRHAFVYGRPTRWQHELGCPKTFLLRKPQLATYLVCKASNFDSTYIDVKKMITRKTFHRNFSSNFFFRFFTKKLTQ